MAASKHVDFPGLNQQLWSSMGMVHGIFSNKKTCLNMFNQQTLGIEDYKSKTKALLGEFVLIGDFQALWKKKDSR